MEAVMELIHEMKFGSDVFFNFVKILDRSKIAFLDDRKIKYRCFKLASGKKQIVIKEHIIPRYFTGVHKVNDTFTFIALDKRVIPTKVWITLKNNHIHRVLTNAYHMNGCPLNKAADTTEKISLWEICIDHLKNLDINKALPQLFMTLRIWRGLDLQINCDKNLYTIVPSQEYDFSVALISTRKKFIQKIIGKRKTPIPLLHF